MINTTEPKIVRIILIAIALLCVFLFLIARLLMVIIEVFRSEIGHYIDSIFEQESYSAIKLTCLVALVTVPLNLIFGIMAAQCITKFDFYGKAILTTLIELPFSVSPVIAGLIYVLLFGNDSILGEWLAKYDISIIFAVPGIIIATTFVTFPLVVKELIPLMQKQGYNEEEAALSLGATGLQTFFYVTFPKIQWALLYGVLLCNARAMGEFGAVSVVSSYIWGATNTIPLHVEILYNEYNFIGAFVVASILAILAVITLIVKLFVETKYNHYDNLRDNNMSIVIENVPKKRVILKF